MHGLRPLALLLIIHWAACANAHADSLDTIPLFRIEQGEVKPFQLRQETRYVAFYYSASWCPPCRTTTPALIREYQKMLQQGDLPVEIVLVGDDHSEAKMHSYIKHYKMPWPAVQWHARDMTEPYAARGIPHMALVERSSGDILVSGTGTSGSGSIETVVARIREITGDTSQEPFQVEAAFGRYAVLLAIALSVLAIGVIARLRKNKK